MRAHRDPTPEEIDELLAFLPIFSAEGYEPVVREEIPRNADGTLGLIPDIEYDAAVEAFMDRLTGPLWLDGNYNPQEAEAMLADPATLESASFAQIRIMFTYCKRQERFCTGLWGEMIRTGHIPRLLERLRELRDL